MWVWTGWGLVKGEREIERQRGKERENKGEMEEGREVGREPLIN